MREKDILDKMDEIIKLLQDIKQNTTPAFTIQPFVPSVWDGTNWDNYDVNTGGWVDPIGVTEPFVPSCTCEHCKPSTSTAGGCHKCGCRLVSKMTEDGHWYCNRCI